MPTSRSPWLRLVARRKATRKADSDTADFSALGIWNAGETDYSKIPPRGWLLGNVFCRRFLSSIIADGGIGKTALRVAQCISLALGRSLTGEHVFKRSRVLLLSFEDDKNELDRRVYAVLRHHGIDRAELDGWLFLAAPKNMKLLEMKDGSPKTGQLESLLRSAIRKLQIDLVCLDPFIKAHGVDENSNNAIDQVCDLLATVAIEYDCAIDFPHHTRKGVLAAGNADTSRGASASKDAARLVYTLTQMTPEEAEQFGIPEAERRSLVRLDSGKVNIAPPSRDARWFCIVGVPLGNGAGLYPHGDEVQTVIPWTPPKLWDGIDNLLCNRILDDIGAGLPNGQRYSGARSADKRAAWRVVQQHIPDKTEAQCREIIRAWTKSRVLVAETYDDPVDRKPREGLRVDPVKRPS